ncbi:hypothetical protein [Sinimarinibacterium sp. NLF-5-8]|uniref:hypothetical protein n=1 Tax=Sinimarinibacterium sp. NLF-5-8 TaxID=2698684 RepID=UPI00137BF497|nr:hypothetical protein [Sinimarinibacterium sp. NLF-5-8]QHS09019.1 hypothetical protein GT972_01915 [Sinimarinibacterium sp. NLF-5-8]
MGTYFGYHSKDQLVKELTEESSVHDYSLRGNCLWLLRKSKWNGKMFIELCLIKTYGGDWGYKPLSEGVHPYYYNCPERLLAKSEDDSETAINWRAKCRSVRSEQGEKQRLAEQIKAAPFGTQFGYRSKIVTLVDPGFYRVSRGRVACRFPNGDIFAVRVSDLCAV